jgi:hypothetical protein
MLGLEQHGASAARGARGSSSSAETASLYLGGGGTDAGRQRLI